LIKAGVGTLTLSAATADNTYSGTTTISTGTLVASKPGALPGYGASGRVVVNGGTLTLSAGGSGWTEGNIYSLLNANGSGFASGSALGIDTSNATSGFPYEYAIPTLSMGLTKLGSNSLILTKSNNYTGTTTISAGTLQFGDGISSGNDGALPNSASIIDNASLVYNVVGTPSYSGVISGTGDLTKSGPGTLTLSGTGANTFSGTTTISGGAASTLRLAKSGALQGSTVIAPTSTAGNIVFDSSVGSHAFTFGGLSGSGNIGLKDNTNFPITLTVGGNNGSTTYSGALSDSGASGSASLTKTGTGTLILSSATSNTYSGVTTVSQGTLVVTKPAALPGYNAANRVVVNGGTLALRVGGSGWTTANVDSLLSANSSGFTSGSLGIDTTNATGGFSYTSNTNRNMGLTKLGSNALTLTGSNAWNGGTTINGGTLVVASAGSLSTGSSDLYVGKTVPAAMIVQDNASAAVGGNLYVNQSTTNSESPSTLTLQSGPFTVAGQTIIGNATMYADPSITSAAVYQSGGTATLTGLLTVGNAGTATSLYDGNGGTLNANGGLLVGNQGNGSVNIHGSATVNVSGQGLIIGQDSGLATSGTLNLSGGTLAITGDVILGKGGIGTLSRSGGTMTVTGTGVTGRLVIGGAAATSGAAILIVDGTSGSLDTSFRTLYRDSGSTATLVVVPYTGHLDTTEKVSFATPPNLHIPNGIIGPWAVVQSSGSQTSGDYLTISSNQLAAVTNYYSGLSGSNNTKVVVTNSSPLTQDAFAYVVKVATGTNTNLNGYKLTVGKDGVSGMIFDGGTVTGGTIAFDGKPLIFAGTSTPGTIGSAINTTSGLVKFGPGTLVLSADSRATMSGDIVISSGALNVQNSGALGPGGAGNGTMKVAAGAALEVQNNIALTNVPVTLNGSGVNGGGALKSIQDNNSLTGSVILGNNAQINTAAGSLTLSGPIQGAYSLTTTGGGMLVLSNDNWNTFTGPITVGSGTLAVAQDRALGAVGSTNGTTVSSGATLAFQGGTLNVAAEPVTVSGTGAGSNGAIRNLSGTNFFNGPITLVGDTQVNVDSGSLDLTGGISGTFSVTKAGPGMLKLSNTGNSFTGMVTVAEGTLSVATSSSATALGAGAAPVVLGSNGKTVTVLFTGPGTATSRAFTLAAAATGTFQTDNNFALSGAIGGNGNLAKTGSATLTLSGTNTFSGTTTVTSGTLAIGSTGAINGTSGILVGQGAALQVTAGNNVNQLPDATNISLGGGRLDFTGNSSGTGESVGALIPNPGSNNIVTRRASGTPYLRFATGPGAHSTGATVNFYSDANSSIQFQANPPALTNGIIGGFAFFSDPDVDPNSRTVDFAM